MGVWGYLPVMLGILIIGTISSNEAFAATVTIDDFQTGSALIDVDTSPDFDFISVTGPGIIPSSGQRDVLLSFDNSFGSIGLLEYEATSGSALYREFGDFDGLLEFTWDNNGAGLNADLTDGSANDQFELRISSTTDFDWALLLTDSTLAFDSDTFSESASPGLTVISVPFSNFPSVDFNNIESIVLVIDIDQFVIGTNIEIDFFQTSGQAPVGSSSIPIDSASLLVADTLSFSWMIPVLLSAIGIGLFVVSRKSENSKI